MDEMLLLSGAQRDNAGLVSIPVESLPPGCKGAACPAFLLCQGRCAKKPATPLARMVHAYGRQVEALSRR